MMDTEGPTLAVVQGDILTDRAGRATDLVEDLLGELEAATPDTDLAQAITEAKRIRDALKVDFLTGEEAFRSGHDGVCLLGEDHEIALLLGHVDRDEAAKRAVKACADFCGSPVEHHDLDGLDVRHQWGVFEDCSDDDYSDWAWWFHRTGEGQMYAVAVTAVHLT